MAKLRAAVVGCGGMGRCHLSALQKMEELELVAACDVMQATLDRRAEEFTMPRTFTDLSAMLEEVRPEVVAVATQTRQHREVVLACAEAGVRGILCEKPLALDLAECDEMLDACTRHGVQMAVNHQGHLRPTTLRAQAMVEQGVIGDLLVVRGVNKGGRKCGNELMEMGTHTTDRMICFGGHATWCHAFVTWDGRAATAADIMDAQEMSPRDRDSGLVLGHRLFAQYGFQRAPFGEMAMYAWEKTLAYGVDLIGTRGQLMLRGSRMDGGLLHLDSPIFDPTRGLDQWNPVTGLPEEPVWGSMDDSVCVMYQHLLRAIETGEPHPSSGDVGRHALEMVMAIYESHRRGARVALPLQDRTHPLDRWKREGG